MAQGIGRTLQIEVLPFLYNKDKEIWDLRAWFDDLSSEALKTLRVGTKFVDQGSQERENSYNKDLKIGGGDIKNILHAMIMSARMMKRIMEYILHAMIRIQWHIVRI